MSQKTWGGRFANRASELMVRINASIGFDKRLWREDIAASKAHAAMLREQAASGGRAGSAATSLRQRVPSRASLLWRGLRFLHHFLLESRSRLASGKQLPLL